METRIIARSPATGRRRRRGRAGFSLVEIALAMLVLGVGLLAAFGLFPTALDASKKAIDETQLTQIADAILASVREAAAHGEWSRIGPGLKISVPNPEEWKDADTLTFEAVGWSVDASPAEKPPIVCRKKNSPIEFEDLQMRYVLAIGEGDRRKKVFLSLFPGQYGAATNLQITYYTEVFRRR